jgi:putative cell wall-binding protein
VKPPFSPNNTWEDQPVPVIQAGSNNAPAASVQILIPTNWESGDKITLQVQSDGVGVPDHTTNCLDASRSISFAGPYGVGDVTVGPYAYADGAGWALGGDGGDLLANAPTNGPTPNPDPKTADTVTPPVAPTFQVALTTSPSCIGVGVTDQIELTFSNTSSDTDVDQFEISFNNIRYNVGAAVNAGPVHVIPFARQAVDLSPGVYLSVPTFFGNMYSPIVSDFFTDNAYISPVSISATGTSIVGDSSLQPLGSITLTETAPDALGNGTHIVCLTNITNVYGPATGVVTGTALATAAITYSGACITVTLATMDAAVINTVTISGLTATSNTDGTVLAALTPGTGGNWPLYLNPDDQTQGGTGVYSDVNVGAYPVALFTFVVGVPARIGGNDRYETSAKIAANLDSGRGDNCSDWAVLVSGSSYPDALSASYLAGALNSNVGWTGDFAAVPVLLIGLNSIPPSVSAYMAAAGVKNVYIVGGNAVVSAAAEAALLNTAATKCTWHTTIGDTAPVPNQKLNVVRVAGADRYATNRAVVNLGSDIFEEGRNRVSLELLQPTKHTAIIATGTGFADALAAGPVSYDGLPLILTDGTSLSASARLTLTDNDIAQVIIIGGTSAVSAAVEAQIQAMGITTGRVAGADRYATATAWADFMANSCAAAPIAGAYDCGLGWGVFDQILLASGTNFADALSAGPMGWAWDAPIILSDPTTLSANTQTWLVANRLALRYVTVLGLGSAVSTGVMNAANLAIS